MGGRRFGFPTGTGVQIETIRAIVDTETTWLDPLNGDRIVEIGRACQSFLNRPDVSSLRAPATR